MDQGRISHYTSCTFEANSGGIEDTHAVETSSPSVGALFGVFDGHTGRAASAFCRDELVT